MEEKPLPPTLLRKNFLIPPKGTSDKDKKIIANTISIEYILHYIADMIPETSTNYIKKGPGAYGDKVIAIKSDTGSGKSTVLPAQLHSTFFHRTRRNIMVTQPRILNAIDIPDTIIQWNPDLVMEKNIGYSTGPFKRLPQEKGIIFATVGILVQELTMNTDEDFLKKYQFIIIDEVHARDEQTDICLYLLKKFLKTNYKDPFCPLVILMSATFDEEIFIKYFDIPPKNYIQVIGSTFPIEMYFPDYSISNYIKYATLKSQKIHLDNLEELNVVSPLGDIIIFVTGLGIGKKIHDDLHVFNSSVLSSSKKLIEYGEKLNIDMESLFKTGNQKTGGADESDKLNKSYYVLPILLDTASFSKGGLDYKNLFSKLEIINVPLWKVNSETNTINFESDPYEYVVPSRRIIISTNLAETGVTIPTLKYCIDTGYNANSEFYPEYGSMSLVTKNISYGSAIQRRGRVGRQFPGKFYPCYTKETFESLPVEQIPNIVNGDTTILLLTILIREKKVDIIQEYSVEKIKNHEENDLFQMFIKFSNDWFTVVNELSTNIADIDLIEMPSIQALNYSVEKLHILGFMNSAYDITAVGFLASKFQFISMELRKFILSGYFYGANILDLITISAFVHVAKRYIFTKAFKLENFMEANNIKCKYYNQILIGDDFINCIFIWNILQDFINKNLKKSDFLDLNKLKEWCVKSEIIFEGIAKVISVRDGIIENMLTIGLNPYYNGLDLPDMTYNLNKILENSLHDGLLEVKKIKGCLYDGFKQNLFQHDKFSTYKSVFKNILVKIKSAVVKQLNEEADQKYPMHIVCSEYSLTSKFGSAQYEFVSNAFVSVLDNFINVDAEFYSH